MTAHYFKEIGLVPHGGMRLVWGYVLGLAISLVLTLGAYVIAFGSTLPMSQLFIVLGVLALVQCVAQLLLFLHLGNDPASREKAAILAGVAVAVTILVAGSIWIMVSLDGRMVHPDDMRAYVEQEPGL